MTTWLWTLIGGCITDLPDTRPETSREMIRDLPATPPPPDVPASAGSQPPSARPTEITMHQVRGTAPGTRVVVSGFVVASDADQVDISADSVGKTLLLRCEGTGDASLGTAGAETPVRVVGNVAAPDGDIVVLTDCTAVPEDVLDRG